MTTTSATIETANAWMMDHGCSYHGQNETDDGDVLVIGWFCGPDARAIHALATSAARETGIYSDAFCDEDDLALVICATRAA